MSYPFSLFPRFRHACPGEPDDPAGSLWFLFDKTMLLLREKPSGPAVPRSRQPPVPAGKIAYRRSIGYLDGVPCVALAIRPGSAPPELIPVSLRQAHAHLGSELFGIAGRAAQVITWQEQHRFCSRCGVPLKEQDNEFLRSCPACRALAYPRISPAVIMAVTKKEHILLGRAPHYPAGMYSTLAGFVEAGETLEDAVQREVWEETGIEVDDIRYLGSQPWPFPHSLMVGFTCRYRSGKIRVNTDELEDAAWFSLDQMPPLPGTLSIARYLIDHVLSRDSG